MPVLLKKLLRTIRSTLGQFIASSVVIATGIMAFVTMTAMSDNLVRSRDSFYRETDFADHFFHVVRAPEGILSRIEAVPGVLRSSVRIQKDVPVLNDGGERTTLRLTGYPLPDDRELNRVKVLSGRIFEKYPEGGAVEVLLNRQFAEAHGFMRGDTIDIAAEGRRKTLTITGTAAGADFVYAVKDAASMLRILHPSEWPSSHRTRSSNYWVKGDPSTRCWSDSTPGRTGSGPSGISRTSSNLRQPCQLPAERPDQRGHTPRRTEPAQGLRQVPPHGLSRDRRADAVRFHREDGSGAAGPDRHNEGRGLRERVAFDPLRGVCLLGGLGRGRDRARPGVVVRWPDVENVPAFVQPSPPCGSPSLQGRRPGVRRYTGGRDPGRFMAARGVLAISLPRRCGRLHLALSVPFFSRTCQD